jgi:hypothetical protein
VKRLFRSSCLGLLALLIFGLVAILSVLAVVFQQSQAVTTRMDATTEVHATPTYRTQQPARATSGISDGDVTIQIEVSTSTVTPLSMTLAAPTNTALSPSMPVSPSIPSGDDIDSPRHSGTSSYPLTVTAEVMLGLTHVAGYQAGVAATRTAIAAESVSIYATLTAAGPTPSGRTP